MINLFISDDVKAYSKLQSSRMTFLIVLPLLALSYAAVTLFIEDNPPTQCVPESRALYIANAIVNLIPGYILAINITLCLLFGEDRHFIPWNGWYLVGMKNKVDLMDMPDPSRTPSPYPMDSRHIG